jgi:predicted TIM-barrel fold metal-dependent hydrolase
VPVAFHTGFQAGNSNYINNSDPTLLSNIFISFPDVKFVLFHGSYPFGGELSAIAKTFRNVSIDMNWTYDISPAYAERYLNEWIETVPLNKIMAFGGDQRMIEMSYGSLLVAKKVVADVLIAKIKDHYFSEEEAKTAARMLLHDNGMEFYNIR